VDFDCDGHHELLVDAGAVAAIIAPRWGGGMLSFDILEREVGLGNVLQRHEEPYHFFSATDDIQLVDDDAATVDYTESAAYTPEQAARLWFDARPRMAFVEHFLGAGTTLDSWYRGRYRDVGDFADGAYEIAKTLKLPDEGEGLVHLGRSGTVEENGQRSLVRLEKSFVFTLSDPRLRVDYHLINRYFEPVRAWLGVEANLALPGTGEGSVPRFRVVGSGGEQEGELQGPLAMERVGYLELIDADHDLVVCVYLDEPRDVWMMPVETLQRIHGDVTLFPQGLSLLIHGDHDLWGSEEQQFSVRLEFLEY